MTIPSHYIPKQLSAKDKKIQKRNIQRSRKMYQKGKYVSRPKLKSFKSKPSRHVANAMRKYNVKNVFPTPELARKTGCSLRTLRKIVNKGRGAYYSSGSRPNQTAESWGLARLASAITGGKASCVDRHLLADGCSFSSKARKAMLSKC